MVEEWPYIGYEKLSILVAKNTDSEGTISELKQISFINKLVKSDYLKE
jgi:hypothetical protein